MLDDLDEYYRQLVGLSILLTPIYCDMIPLQVKSSGVTCRQVKTN
jgi:hypothetical protein